jgi:hypothetical protein
MGFSSYVPLTARKSITPEPASANAEKCDGCHIIVNELVPLSAYSWEEVMNKTRTSEISGGRGSPKPTLTPSSLVAKMKGRQCAKIRDLRQALIDAGFRSLDHQAMALGLSRSTAWSVLQGHHKASGLSASIISRMMASPRLPLSASTVLLEYVKERSAGAYGHNGTQVSRFLRRLNENSATASSSAIRSA